MLSSLYPLPSSSCSRRTHTRKPSRAPFKIWSSVDHQRHASIAFVLWQSGPPFHGAESQQSTLNIFLISVILPVRLREPNLTDEKAGARLLGTGTNALTYLCRFAGPWRRPLCAFSQTKASGGTTHHPFRFHAYHERGKGEQEIGLRPPSSPEPMSTYQAGALVLELCHILMLHPIPPAEQRSSPLHPGSAPLYLVHCSCASSRFSAAAAAAAAARHSAAVYEGYSASRQERRDNVATLL